MGLVMSHISPCMYVDGCAQHSIRLQDGSSIADGRVEVCSNNHWGTVCDDSFGSVEARLVCEQQGFMTTGSKDFI